MKFLQRVEDFFRGQKDKSEIINTQQFSFSETYMWNGEKHLGDKNHFFGKKHSNETIEKIREHSIKTQKVARNPIFMVESIIPNQ